MQLKLTGNRLALHRPDSEPDSNSFVCIASSLPFLGKRRERSGIDMDIVVAAKAIKSPSIDADLEDLTSLKPHLVRYGGLTPPARRSTVSVATVIVDRWPGPVSNTCDLHKCVQCWRIGAARHHQ